MKKSTRLLIMLIVIEVLLFTIGAWLIRGLISGDLHATNSPAESARTIFTFMGCVMGAIGGVSGMSIVALRKKGQ